LSIVTLPHATAGSVAPNFAESVDLTATDVKVGEKYAVILPDFGTPVMLEFRKELTTGVLRFTKYGTDLEISIPKGEWDVMRSNGRACRISEGGRRGRTAGEIEDIDPYSLLDPDEPSITLKEQKRRLLASQRLQWARTLRFYVLRYDEAPAGTGHVGVRRFINDNFEDAKKSGFQEKPSSGAIQNAVKFYGEAGNRSLSAFLSKRGLHDRGKRWPDFTIDLAVAMNTAYWSKRQTRKIDVISDFYTAFNEENDRRAVLRQKADENGRKIGPDEEALLRPSRETLRLWIGAGENYWSWRSKFGEPSARNRFKAHGRAIEATEPLEYVIIDHTRIDAWAAVKNEDGVTVLVERPWLTLAIDVYSKMILGAVLTYHSPSVYSALLCLRQVVRRKSFLIEKYGDYKGATDGWGMPKNLIVDNGWEFVGISFQVCCEAVGINVIWAPVKAPEFKAYVERAFGTLNAMVWHRLEEGIPLKQHQMAALDFDPRVKAIHRLEWMYDRMWRAIVTIYHLEEHGEKKIIPAKRWREGLMENGRPTIDDVGDLDKVLGRSAHCLLTPAGITYKNHRFHDKQITGELLDRLLRHAPKRRQRRGMHPSGVVPVLCTWDPDDCSFIHVWDLKLRKNIRLPNWDRAFSNGLSWKTAADIRQFAHERNQDFQSDTEKYAARADFNRSLRQDLPFLPFGQARKAAAEIAGPQLVAGEYVEQVVMAAPAAGCESVDVPQGLPARERTDDRIPGTGPRRGGKAATRNAKAGRERNAAWTAQKEAERAKASASSETKRMPVLIVPVTSMTNAEAQDRLAALADDLD
jgi:putative transposase